MVWLAGGKDRIQIEQAMRGLKNIMVNVFLVTVGLFVGLLVIEIGVRVAGVYRFPMDDFIQRHPELGWSHVPNKEGYWTIGNEHIPVKINSKGLRDREYSYEKEEGTFRILVLGDSFTEGLQVPVEDTFCKVLEIELNRTEKKFEVINAGFPGVGTDYELLFMRREGWKYRPDLVILSFFGNDIYDNYRSKSVLQNETGPVAYEKRGVIANLKGFLAENSCAYNYLGYTLPKRLPRVARVLMKIGLLSEQPIDDAQGGGHLQYVVFHKKYGPETEKAWRVTEVLVLQLKKAVASCGGRLAVISIPFREQVENELWKGILSRPGMKERAWDLNKPDHMLSGFLRDAGIPFLPLVSYFRQAAEQSQLYHPVDKHGRDGHWNKAGHHLAGHIICRWLVDEKLVPNFDGSGIDQNGKIEADSPRAEVVPMGGNGLDHFVD